MEVWFEEFLQGFIRLMTQPLLYWSIILLFVISIRRMKQERRRFGTRVYDIFTEGRSTWRVSLVAGFLISIFALAGGMVFTTASLLVVTGITILLSLPLKLTWLSPAYTLGISILLIFGISYVPGLSFIEQTIPGVTGVSLPGMAIILSILLVVEGVFLMKTSSRRTFPERVPGPRGKKIGQHRVKKLALIPMVTLFPAGMIEPVADWWPLFSIGEGRYGLVMFPVLLGYEWLARAQSPKLSAIRLGRQTIAIAVVTLFIAVSSIFFPVLAAAAVLIAVLGRLAIYSIHSSREKNQPYFTEDHRGVRILGTIPGSPADEMDLLPGELIIRVNGIYVSSVNELYEALQTNRALTKIEVKDFQGENRFEQRAMYEGEHHQLGLLFVQENSYEPMAQ
ncbi:PDZ domain-containing protein [Halobacillus campisalis]|uniref:PDZ domain-containing protein n=1 Tax=Halobacillus campisalis TaxID=435909 RepID=A0ABW2K6X8_9BACI|nr:PDZ domain-containing protein [Halobacillus campisalis]